MKDQKALYRRTFAYAKDHGETDLYRASLRENIACRDAIEAAIKENYSNNILDKKAVATVVDRFGIDRVNYVLAATIRQADWDGRYSKSNKDWAKSVGICADKDPWGQERCMEFRITQTHPGLVNLFTDQVHQSEKSAQEAIPEGHIKALKLIPGEKPETVVISNDLESLQKMVGGYIEVVYPYDDPVALIVNEEGKLDGLPLNRALRDDSGYIYDVLSGTALVVGLGDEDFISLSPEMLDKYEKLFHEPEAFAYGPDGNLIVLSSEKQKPPKKMPEYSFAALPSGEVIKIDYRKDGYTRMHSFIPEEPGAIDALNDAIGVTKAQAAAMEAGMKYGWDCLGANPDNYDENGKPVCIETMAQNTVDKLLTNCQDVELMD